MREIKFRGKRFDENNNNWIYGHLHIIDTCGDGYTGKAIQQQYGKDRPFSVRVKDETIGQYTGLKDKNGKEIFEGDICRYFNPEDKDGICEIKEDYALWISGTIKETNLLTPLFYLKCSSEWEVIGNIHENPELLER